MKINRSIFFNVIKRNESLHIYVCTFNHQANASDDADFENERAVRNKKKSNIKMNILTPEDEYMDFAIEDEVYMIFLSFERFF